ncbi:hypothetical protein B0H16DRAFT_1452139 [Mycena metata]|uniref:Uncharacterized protein n=1 Tax=Mycena metata TaxID=1033252 RepID=A0AAD7H7S5_9AGAR|nr:hypothetical protein B0H16DRAFT_1478621 [Mycena metata]KAJ7770724.1 hypothetical protein B0H16DRAFT_1452139 [Mycena metata]
MSTAAVTPASKPKKRSLKPLPPRSTASMPDGARRPCPPPRVPTPPTMCPPSPSWVAAWSTLFDDLQQPLEQEKRAQAEAGDASICTRDSGNVDGIEDDPVEANVVYVEGSEEQLATAANFEALLQEPLRTEQEYRANWDLAPWPANVDPAKRKAMIAARVRKMNGVLDE